MLLRSGVLGWSTRTKLVPAFQRVARALLKTGPPARSTLAPRVTGVTVTAAAQAAASKTVQEQPKSFQQLGLIPELQAALNELAITTPTEIQVCNSVPVCRLRPEHVI